MKTSEIYIRDPFILPFEGKYYMYASNFPKGFKAYVSENLEDWSEPVEVINFPDGFWATKDFWAPEVHFYKGNFYLFASLCSENRNRGTQIFRASSPLGPFEIISDGPQTPAEWMCLDGTLYVDKCGTPYMVFCHDWLQIKNGEMCYIKLSDDLSRAAGEPQLMFKAHDFPFVHPYVADDCYVTDGCFMRRNTNGDLLMIWSSYGEKGYFEGVLKSDNGEIDGDWSACPFLFETNGGHGMIFKDFDGGLKLCLHSPNRPAGAERMKLFEIEDKNGVLSVK